MNKLNTIKDLDEYARLNNYGLKFNKAHQLCGIKKFDYYLGEVV